MVYIKINKWGMSTPTFLIEKLQNFMEVRQVHLEDEQIMVKLSIKELRSITAFIEYLLLPLKLLYKTENLCMFLKNTCIAEFLLKNKRTTSNDSVPLCLINTQIIRLLKTLGQASIIKDEDYLHYWTCLTKDLSRKWWYGAETGYVDLDLNSSNGCLPKTLQNSWFSTELKKFQNKNLQKIFLPFYKFLLADGTVKDDTPLIRTKKIKLKLNSIQKKKFKVWSDHARYSYNKCVGLINGEDCVEQEFRDYYKPFGKESKESEPGFIKRNSSFNNYSKLDLRNLITPETVNSRTKWVLETPKHVREDAVFEAFKNKQACITNYKNGNISHFDLKYKTKKNKKWTISVPKSSLKLHDSNSVGIYEGITTNFRVRTCEKINRIDKDCTIHFDGLDYFLCVPEEKARNNKTIPNFFAALDPGVRKFQTLYCPDENHFIKIGDRASERINKLLLSLDNLVSRRDKSKTKAYDKTILKLRVKIQNLQGEMHYKTANFLCNNYSNILIPKLTKNNDILSKTKRRLTTKTVRKMVVLGHCKFVERLITKAEEFSNVQVNIVTEEYTSQTCLRCCKRTKLSSELFKCNYCSFELDRDFLGSKNILLKNW